VLVVVLVVVLLAVLVVGGWGDGGGDQEPVTNCPKFRYIDDRAQLGIDFPYSVRFIKFKLTRSLFPFGESSHVGPPTPA
jgi:hypothetical protein